MYAIKGAIRHEEGVRHYRYTIHLEQSLVELFKVYDEAGGAVPHAGALLDARLERCLGDARSPRHLVQGRLHTLRRAKDLHQFLISEPELRTIKLQLLEHVLFERTPEARWAAVRELLLRHIDTICGTPAAGLLGNAEIYKEQLSRRTSPLGRMLIATALFNFDLAAEEPPPNLVIRFRNGAFPDHGWECRGGTPRDAQAARAAGWTPDHPLCRWEYLAADLAHTLFRREQPAPRDVRHSSPRAAGPHGAGPASPEAVRVYCRIEGAGGEAARQLELLPTDPESLLTGLQRTIHRRHRSEGVRAFAALLARLDDSGAGEPVTFALSEIAEAAFGPLRRGRQRRARIGRVRAVLERMAAVECTRVFAGEHGRTARSTRLLTVIGRSAEWPHALAGAGGAQAPLPEGEPEDERLTVLLDPVFYAEAEETLGSPYVGLPAALLDEEGVRHPLALPLFVHLRRLWARSPDGVHHAAAERLFAECGLWCRSDSPYRAVEQLKQALGYLKQAGLIRGWRLTERGRGQPLADRYRIEAPVPLDPAGSAGAAVGWPGG